MAQAQGNTWARVWRTQATRSTRHKHGAYAYMQGLTGAEKYMVQAGLGLVVWVCPTGRNAGRAYVVRCKRSYRVRGYWCPSPTGPTYGYGQCPNGWRYFAGVPTVAQALALRRAGYSPVGQ